ncbi:unnamed protein product [Paramecium pentaurelia]|uniref:Uncharacterized protein n=1 Tax=Paramecium pentaurelia TaxID=43138 RepID=A0A8S1SX37_9CILI|nr:unnamed protein product [Paramecium pentaurelia]
MADKFLQLTNNYGYQYQRRTQKLNDQAQHSQRIYTDVSPLPKQNNPIYNSPRKLMKTTCASFFDHFQKLPSPKLTAYQTYLQTILQNKNEIQAKQNYQPSFTLHNIYGQKINTQKLSKDTIKQIQNQQQNKSVCKIQLKNTTNSNSQYHSPRKTRIQCINNQSRIQIINNQSKQIQKSKIDIIQEKSDQQQLQSKIQNIESKRILTFDDNFDDIEPWNTSEQKY